MNEAFASPNVSAKIFCICFGKTGTTSLRAFFAALGFKPGDQAKGELLVREWALRNFEPIIELANSAQVFSDIPFSLHFTFSALDMAFPGSKFVLSVRDSAEQWYASLLRFNTLIVGKGRLPTGDDLKEFSYRHRGWVLEAAQLIYGVSEEDPFNKSRLMAAYENHNYAVQQYFRYRPKTLIVVNLADDGAARKMCEFLGLSYAGQSMPHLNPS